MLRRLPRLVALCLLFGVIPAASLFSGDDDDGGVSTYCTCAAAVLKLHFAVEQRDVAGVRRLLEEGADVDAKDDQGKTLLRKAAGSSYWEIVVVLIEAGAGGLEERCFGYRREDFLSCVIGEVAFGEIHGDAKAVAGFLSIIRILLEEGSPHRLSENALNALVADDGWTPLHEALYEQVDVAVVQWLLAIRPDWLNQVGQRTAPEFRGTPLDCLLQSLYVSEVLVGQMNTEAVAFLLEAGAQTAEMLGEDVPEHMSVKMYARNMAYYERWDMLTHFLRAVEPSALGRERRLDLIEGYLGFIQTPGWMERMSKRTQERMTRWYAYRGGRLPVESACCTSDEVDIVRDERGDHLAFVPEALERADGRRVFIDRESL